MPQKQMSRVKQQHRPARLRVGIGRKRHREYEGQSGERERNGMGAEAAARGIPDLHSGTASGACPHATLLLVVGVLVHVNHLLTGLLTIVLRGRGSVACAWT